LFFRLPTLLPRRVVGGASENRDEEKEKERKDALVPQGRRSGSNNEQGKRNGCHARCKAANVYPSNSATETTMFLDESAFDDADGKFKRRELGRSLSPKREALTAKYGGSGPALKVEDVEEETFGSAGGLGVESGSRARMLAQQREIQLKNRQKALQSGGMIRSSLDDARSSADSSQFTPAARQFSAPKTVKDSSADAPGEEGTSEFRVPPARKPVPVAKSVGRASRFSDDEDEDDDYRRRRQVRL